MNLLLASLTSLNFIVPDEAPTSNKTSAKLYKKHSEEKKKCLKVDICNANTRYQFQLQFKGEIN